MLVETTGCPCHFQYRKCHGCTPTEVILHPNPITCTARYSFAAKTFVCVVFVVYIHVNSTKCVVTNWFLQVIPLPSEITWADTNLSIWLQKKVEDDQRMQLNDGELPPLELPQGDARRLPRSPPAPSWNVSCARIPLDLIPHCRYDLFVLCVGTCARVATPPAPRRRRRRCIRCCTVLYRCTPVHRSPT